MSPGWEAHSQQEAPKSGSYNYKGLFFIAMLVLVDADYKFRGVDVSTEGSFYYAQIKIEGG